MGKLTQRHKSLNKHTGEVSFWLKRPKVLKADQTYKQKGCGSRWGFIFLTNYTNNLLRAETFPDFLLLLQPKLCLKNSCFERKCWFLRGVASVKENQKQCYEILEAIIFLAFPSNITLKKCLLKKFERQVFEILPNRARTWAGMWAVDCNRSS